MDILIRNLLDLPEDASALRHTYLRVLYPLLAHTQLRCPPHYKRDELKLMLNILVHGQLLGDTGDDKIQHFEDVDETTKRLVFRCATVDWLRDPAQQTSSSASPTDQDQSQDQGQEPDEEPGERHHHRKPSAIRRLGMHLEPASSSTLSVKEVASQHEKPGVMTPSRTDVPGVEFVHPAAAAATAANVKGKKVKPEPPKTRRWRGRRNTNAGEQIPEDLPPPLPTTTSTARSEDRRNSNSSLAPPVPAHVQRSASNPPAPAPPASPSPAVSPKPAVPPPRRSTHVSDSAKGQKPEPPPTRRWRAQSRSQEVHSRSQDQSQDQAQEHETVSVEEAIKHVTL